MKLLIMHFSAASCQFLAVRLKYPPQHSVFKHFQLNQPELYHHCIQNLVSYLFTVRFFIFISALTFRRLTSTIVDVPHR